MSIEGETIDEEIAAAIVFTLEFFKKKSVRVFRGNLGENLGQPSRWTQVGRDLAEVRCQELQERLQVNRRR